MRELERNGWHKVSRGLAPFIDSVEDDSKRFVNKKVYKEAYDKAKNYADFCNIELTTTAQRNGVYEVELYGYRGDIDNWERLMKNKAYDSINDSLASDVYSELKRQFPDIQIQMKSRPHATPHAFLKCTDFSFPDSNSKLDSVMKFCQHLAKKYNSDKTNIYVNEYSHKLQLTEYTGIDSKTQAAISEYVKHVEETVHAAYPKVDVRTKTEANVKGLSLTLEFLNTSSYPNCMEKIQKNISSFFATRIPNGIILKTEVDELQRLAKTPLRFKDSKAKLDSAMKVVNIIKAKDFGMRNPARIVPEHPTWSPEYDLPSFKSKLEFFIKQTIGRDATSGMKQIDGLLETLLNDYRVDIKNTIVDKSKTRDFYKKYVEVANQLVNKYGKQVPGPVRAMIEERLYEIK